MPCAPERVPDYSRLVYNIFTFQCQDRLVMPWWPQWPPHGDALCSGQSTWLLDCFTIYLYITWLISCLYMLQCQDRLVMPWWPQRPPHGDALCSGQSARLLPRGTRLIPCLQISEHEPQPLLGDELKEIFQERSPLLSLLCKFTKVSREDKGTPRLLYHNDPKCLDRSGQTV